MKIKQEPADFRVEEISRLEPGVAGPFGLYRLEKRGIGTPEAVRALRRAWRLAPDRVSFAGLKDRHGHTGQMISVHGGPRRNHDGGRWRVNYLGHAHEPAVRGTIEANGFRIVVRDLAPAEAERIAERAAAAGREGFPNYYDDQRFGSLRGTGGRFVVDALLDGDPEAALRLAIASPAREDRSRIRRRRRLLRDRWGAWDHLAAVLEPCAERAQVLHLAGGGSFADAYAMLPAELRSLHRAAWQAALFNEELRALVGPGPEHPGAAGPYRFPAADPGPLRHRHLPLASAAAPPDDRLDAALAARGRTRADLERLPFRRGRRETFVVPYGLAVGTPADDRLNPGRVRIEVRFRLPPGAYATMLLKRCSFDFGRSKSDRPA